VHVGWCHHHHLARPGENHGALSGPPSPTQRPRAVHLDSGQFAKLASKKGSDRNYAGNRGITGLIYAKKSETSRKNPQFFHINSHSTRRSGSASRVPEPALATIPLPIIPLTKIRLVAFNKKTLAIALRGKSTTCDDTAGKMRFAAPFPSSTPPQK
jgi:hypothetical protein